MVGGDFTLTPTLSLKGEGVIRGGIMSFMVPG